VEHQGSGLIESKASKDGNRRNPIRRSVALHAWLSNQENFRDAVVAVVQCGGDTDTTAAIVGGIVGCHVGKIGIPEEWLRNLLEWPRTVFLDGTVSKPTRWGD
jgi:hypothetical protein